jgi:hypothetical protein
MFPSLFVTTFVIPIGFHPQVATPDISILFWSTDQGYYPGRASLLPCVNALGPVKV